MTLASPDPISVLPAPDPRHERLDRALFGLMILVLLAPVWLLSHFPTTDGPAHVANADIIKDYHAPDATAYREFYTLRTRPDTNVIGHYVMAGLMFLVPPLVAEKIFLSGYIVLLPLAFRYAAGGARPSGATRTAFLVFPFVLSYVLHMGFYNFCTSIGVYFLTVGYWLRHRERFKAWSAGVLFVLIHFLYVCHIFSLMLAWATIGIVGGWLALREALVLRREGRLTAGALVPLALHRLAIPYGLSLPAMALAVRWIRNNRISSVRLPLTDKLEWLATVDCLVSFHHWEAWITILLLVVLAALLACVLFGPARRHATSPTVLPFLFVALAFTALYLVVKEKVYVTHRLNLYVFVALAFYLAISVTGRIAERAAQVAGAAFAIALLAAHVPTYLKYAEQYRDCLSVARSIPTDTTLLMLPYSMFGAGRVSQQTGAMYTVSGYIAAEKNAVDFRNYEANTNFFPVQYRPELDPYVADNKLVVHRLGLDTEPPSIDLEAYRAKTGKMPQYIIVWDRDHKFPDDAEAPRRESDKARLDDQLRRLYEKTDTSASGLAELWKRKG